MKIVHLLAVVVMALISACSTTRQPGLVPASHGHGADVPVWVDGGYLAVGEEPIYRKANGRAAIVFTLDHDPETDNYMFPTMAFDFKTPTGAFTCSTKNPTTVVCAPNPSSSYPPASYPYWIKVVLRSNPTKEIRLDPFIITN